MEVIRRYNESEDPFALKFEQAYDDVHSAKEDCDEIRSFFKQEYDVSDNDFIVLDNASASKCM